MARHLQRVIATATLVVFGAVLLPAAAQAAGNGDWSAYPKRAKSAGPQFTPRQYFFFDLGPGGTVSDTATLTNAKSTPRTLDLYPADAFNVRTGGGFGLTSVNDQPSDVGTWIKLSKTRVIIPGAKQVTNKKTGKKELVEGSVNVPFTLTVPKTATPGDHAGGIVTIEPTPTTTVQQPTGAVIGVRRSLAVRIYTRVSGPLNAQLLISDVHFTKIQPAVMPFLGDQGGATIEFTYVNSGNVRLTPKTNISFKGLLGRTIHNSNDPVPEILPGQTITLTAAVTGMPVLDQVTARVAMSGDATADRSLRGLSTAGDASAWCISVIFLVVLVLLIVAIVIWRIRARRKAQPVPGGGKRRAKSPANQASPV